MTGTITRMAALLGGGLAVLVALFGVAGLRLPPYTQEVIYAQVARPGAPQADGWALLLVDVARSASLVVDNPALYPLTPLAVDDERGELLLMLLVGEPVMLWYDPVSTTLTQREISDTPAALDEVASPDGAYVAAWEGETFVLRREDGTTAYDITLERPIFRVTWAPDSRWLAVQTSDGIRARVYTFDVQRRHMISMNGPVAGGLDVEFVMWSPDSRYLFGGSSNFTGGFGSVTEPDGANARRLTDEPVFYRAWSPSGRYLFYGIRGTTGNQLDIRDAAANFGFVDRISNISAPQWRDDDTLYLITGARGRTQRQLSHFDPATGAMTVLSPERVVVETWYDVRP